MRHNIVESRKPDFQNSPEWPNVASSGLSMLHFQPFLTARFDVDPPESSSMKARHASESDEAKESNDPADSKAEQGDVLRVLIRGEEVEV